jgi:hypothetical protein
LVVLGVDRVNFNQTACWRSSRNNQQETFVKIDGTERVDVTLSELWNRA